MLNIESKNLFYKSCSVWYAIWECNKEMKVKLSFGHKAAILSLYKLNIEPKNLFYKSCSVCYTIWKFHIKNGNEAVIWLQSSHFVTF